MIGVIVKEMIRDINNPAFRFSSKPRFMITKLIKKVDATENITDIAEKNKTDRNKPSLRMKLRIINL
jgi:hypothetical protein